MLICFDKCNMFQGHTKIFLGEILTPLRLDFHMDGSPPQVVLTVVFSCENVAAKRTFLVNAHCCGETACHEICGFDNSIALILAWLKVLVFELSAWISLDICIQYFSRGGP